MFENTQTLEDRRYFERFKARYPAKIKDSRYSFGSMMHLRDASAQGIKIVSQEQLFFNDVVTVEVKLPDGNNPMDITGRVVWVRRNDMNQYEIGLRLPKIDLLHMSRLYKFIEPPID